VMNTKRLLTKVLSLSCLPVVAIAFASAAWANGLTITNGEVLDQNTAQSTVNVQFDLSWQNAWKDGVNHDAVWLFMKYSDDDGVTWNHATMAISGTNPSGFSSGTGTALDIVVPQDLKGAFISKSSSGVGSVAASDVTVSWDYGLDGVADDKVLSSLIVKIFAVEMVYVSDGAFYAGDTASTASFQQGSADTDPWYISAAGSIQVTNIASDGYYYVSGGYIGEDGTGTAFSIPSTFPNGYNGFYMMKYEVTEGEWVSFFNTLTDAQKAARDVTGAAGKNTDGEYKRNTIAWTSGKSTTSRDDRAVSYLSWPDGCSFADWAGLRPMTELEFEKAARGATNAATAQEYAWGTASVTAVSSISGTENGSETASTGSNAVFNSVTFTGGDGGQGPVRAGIFAKASTVRTAAGAGFYGAMELSGNVAERVVSVGNSQGRAFTGTHGDGELSAGGFANNADWPGYTAGEVSDSAGSGMRGGSWSDVSARLRVSDRQEATQSVSIRNSKLGFRAVRTKP
jgi:formylglycine-generating enzyme required for sulfatase activity